MAASYSTDLTTLTANETNGMVEPTATGWTNLNAFSSAETDYFIQGIACTSATMKVGVGGSLTNNTAFTLGTDDAVLCWAYLWCPANLDTEAGDGARQMIGSSTANFYWVTQSGSDDWLYGGWRCFAMGNPAQITVNTQGTPTTSYAYTGWAADMLAVPGKGNPYGVDAVRKGRCQIKVTGSTATFTEVEEFNSKNSTAARTGFTLLDSGYHRLGLFQYQNGSYLWKGKLLIGETGVTSCTFSDSNKSILVENTKNVTANFNLIEVQHTGTSLTWTGIAISSLGTVSKGRFLVTDAPTALTLASCTFTDMDTFVFNASGTQNVTGTVFRRCGQVTAGSTAVDSCLFDKSTAAIALKCGSSVAGLSNIDFVSSGTGHAIEITGGTSHTLSGITFTNYASTSGSTGNESVYVNIGSGSVTIYADSTFSYRTAGATVTIIAGSVTTSVTVTNEAGTALNGARVALYAKDATGDMPYQDTITISNSGTTATVTHTGHNMLTNDKVLIEGASLDANNGVYIITFISANSYSYTMASTPGSSPTGTIKATWVAIYDETVTAGTLSMSRVFATDQPVSGWARKSTSAPYYKTGPISGIIDSGTGVSLTALLLSDE